MDTGKKSVRAQYEAHFNQHIDLLKTLAQRHRMRFMACTTQNDASEQLAQSMELKAI
jgi:uncharacterized membrane-anchored protein YhcB (DUF1043 family)